VRLEKAWGFSPGVVLESLRLAWVDPFDSKSVGVDMMEQELKERGRTMGAI
jgi:hypothetical protein